MVGHPGVGVQKNLTEKFHTHHSATKLKNCLWGGTDLSICLGGGLFGQELKFNEIPVGGEPKIVDKIIFLWLETRAIEYFLEINGIVLKQQDHMTKWSSLETRPKDKWISLETRPHEWALNG